jgi:sugar phosphate permease
MAAAAAATWNYLSAGRTPLAIRLHQPDEIRRLLPVALLVNALSTLAQGFTDDLTVFLLLCLVNGISNGAVFVQAPVPVLEWQPATTGRASPA